MYLHLGGDVVIKKSSIIGIFDIENTSVSKDTKEFLARASKGEVVYVGYELPKSFIVSSKEGKQVVYISPISVSTLRKRMKNSRMSIIE